SRERRIRASPGRPYFTAFVNSSLTSRRTAKRASGWESRVSSRSTAARACATARSIAGRCSSSLRSSPAAMPSRLPNLRNLYRFRVAFVQSRERQVAENEVRFRALNERLQEQGGVWQAG